MVKLSQCLAPGGVFLRQSPVDANEVIGLLADHLASCGIVKPSYREAVRAREAIMPTGLPLDDDFAVAVPHTDPEHVLTSGMAVAVLDRPTPFGSMDDPETMLPVRVVFVLALRSKDEQIDMLTAIGGLLQDGARLKKLSVARSADEVAQLLDGSN